MNRNETAKLLGALKVLDRQDRIQIDDVTLDLWASLWADIPAPAGLQAVKTWLQRHKWFPSPSEIRDLVIEQVCGVPSVDDAKRQIEKAMRLNYPGMAPTYTPDRIVLDAVREIGGVHVFRVSQSEHETTQLWRRFEAKYTDIRSERVESLDIAAAYQALQSGQPANVRQLKERTA